MIINFPNIGKAGCVWCTKCTLQLSFPKEVRWDSTTANETMQPEPDQRWLLQGCADDLEDLRNENDHEARRWGVAPCWTIRTMYIFVIGGCIQSRWVLTQHITLWIIIQLICYMISVKTWRTCNSMGHLPFQTQGPRNIDASTEEAHLSDN